MGLVEGFHKNLLRLVQSRQHSHFQESALAARKQSTDALNFGIQLGWQSNCKRFVSSSALIFFPDSPSSSPSRKSAFSEESTASRPRILAKFSRFMVRQSKLMVFKSRLYVIRTIFDFKGIEALRATALFIRRAGKASREHEKAPRRGPLVCMRCREHCASCAGPCLFSRNIRGYAPDTPEGRTYANYVCVLRVMRVFIVLRAPEILGNLEPLA